MSLIYNATFDSQTRVLSLLDKAGNVISSCEVPSKELVDDITKPLTFRATQDGSTVKLTMYGSPYGDFQTSRDGGKTWVNYTLDTAITLNTGDEVSFRAKFNRTSAQSNNNNSFYFNMTGKIEAWHNVMSLYRTKDFATYDTVVEYAFYQLFRSCASLTKAPVLPATTLAEGCYWDMFVGCTSLVNAPELPATTLATECYKGMFNSCKSLAEAPVLPATTLATECYYGMFNSCKSLTEAPALPATTLAGSCYTSMFQGCTSLIKSPELIANTLAGYCYWNMFSGCSSLNEVRCQIPSSYSSNDISFSYTPYWLSGVSSTGTFYTNAGAHWTSGTSGIPYGWTKVNERDPSVDDSTNPLTFKSTQDGSTVKLTKNGSPSGDFQTSRDGGNTWTDYTIDTAIALNIGDEVAFRAKADRESAQTQLDYFSFQMTGKIEAWHNVVSLYRTNDFATYKSVVGYSFYQLFRSCASLTKAPVLPATTLAVGCYWLMFNGCTSLIKAPVLPATTLASYCYQAMFNECTSLVNAPALPATTLATNCYCYMFYGCTSLTKAPALKATTLANFCYGNMFSGCSSLNEVRCQIPSSYSSSDISSHASDWLEGVSSTGKFYTNSDANWPSSTSGIPEGWTRVNA